ncbi:MAG: hypothetical protein HWD58_17235 [Bacteroidota bacterium]|nr:MAG: hypothetical protein HWD58_17235 [Bacteroidota bacterium]
MSGDHTTQASFIDAWLAQNLSIEEARIELNKQFSSEEDVLYHLNYFKKRGKSYAPEKDYFL